MKRSEFCKRGNIPKGTAARLFHPKSPQMGHDLYVKTCILLKLNEEERETLKRIAFPREALMEYIINNNMSPHEADYLFEFQVRCNFNLGCILQQFFAELGPFLDHFC